jgi:hypothetical protein
MAGQKGGERGFPTADISCDSYVHTCGALFYKVGKIIVNLQCQLKADYVTFQNIYL